MGRTAFRGCVEVIIPHLSGRQAQVFIKLPYELGQNLVLNTVNIEEALQYRFQVSYLGNLQVGGNFRSHCSKPIILVSFLGYEGSNGDDPQQQGRMRIPKAL